jgi:hypothetical protein
LKTGPISDTINIRFAGRMQNASEEGGMRSRANGLPALAIVIILKKGKS